MRVRIDTGTSGSSVIPEKWTLTRKFVAPPSSGGWLACGHRDSAPDVSDKGTGAHRLVKPVPDAPPKEEASLAVEGIKSREDIGDLRSSFVEEVSVDQVARFL
jgi:hypothetical protein